MEQLKDTPDRLKQATPKLVPKTVYIFVFNCERCVDGIKKNH